ncbi:MAG: pilus assembly protein TadG-related protein [Dongiaceae bacterium]
MGKGGILRRFARQLGRFRRHQGGNVTVIVAAAIIPLVGALGLATDTARGFLTKARLSQALDAAALAGGKVYFSDTRDEDIKKFFAANFPSVALPQFNTPYDAEFMQAEVTLGTPVESGETGKEKLQLTAEATIPTTFMRVLGFETLTVHAVTEVARAVKALDVVISMDLSGSMESPQAKIIAARDAAVSFIDTIYGDNATSPQLTVDGTTYDLLNMGFVPWNAKTRVTTQGVAFSSVTTTSVTAFTNPVTGQSQNVLYWANNSQVPLLVNPNDLAGGWSGCIYARYLGDAWNDNDADIVRGQVTVGTGAGQRQWMGWEPMAVDDSEPRSGRWRDNNGNGDPNGPAGTRWVNNNAGDWREKQCNNAYFLDHDTTNNGNDAYDYYVFDNADGSIVNGGNGLTSRPVAVPNPLWPTGQAYTERATNGSVVNKKYSGFMKFIDPTQSYNKPGTVAGRNTNPGSTDCTRCLTRGIIPLTPTKATIRDQIAAIQGSDPDGNTNIEQGLYWGWEVLTPGVPFTQAVTTVPFQRTRAIILLTDGEQVGGAGDAYKGRFGFNEGAGTNDDAAHGTISVLQSVDDNTPPVAQGGTAITVQNNLNNRLKKLADNVKAEGIKLYVIGFDLDGAQHADALQLLNEIASDPDENGEYFFNAPDPEDLESVFAQIAASLSTLRLSM